MASSLNSEITGSHPQTTNRWVVLAVLGVAFCICLIDRLAWANVLSTYATQNRLTPTAVGGYYSAFFFGYLISTTAAGIVADWVGGRRVITFSLLTLGLLTAGFGLTKSFAAGLCVQIAMGLAAGADYSPCIKVISGWFQARDRAIAIGIFLCATPISLILSNAAVPTILGALGWQGVYFVLGGVTFAIGLLVMATVRDPAPMAPGQATPAPRFTSVLRNGPMLIAATCGFFLLWAGFGFAFWANALLVKTQQLSPVKAGFIIAFYGLSGLIGKPMAGWIAGATGYSKFALSIIPSTVFAVSLVLFGYLHDVTAFVICVFVMGLSCWSAAVFIAAAVVDSVGPTLAGTASGAANSLWSLGYILVPIVVGAVFQATASINMALGTLATGPSIAAGLAAVGWLVSRRRRDLAV